MKKLIWLVALLASFTAQAQGAPAASQSPQLKIGAETQAWMDLQISGAAAETELRPVAGEVAGEVYQRYVNSFKYAIPEAFEREAFISGGGSK